MGHIFDLESPVHLVRKSQDLNGGWGEHACEPEPARKGSKFNGSRGRSPHRQNKIAIRNTQIAKDTSIVPVAVANSVWREASFWLGEKLPHKWIADLAERAEVIYAHNPRFRKLLRQSGSAGRDWLWAFARHWLSGLLIEHRPSLADRLPSAYKVGKPLSA